ncbi:PilZ domain-containing protein [Deltaproteobacteria bacterium TL4]
MAGERRKYLRVLFEETIEVITPEWTDSMATGLDISLNGTRFHCENSLAEGDQVTIRFNENFELVGEVRWCWPIEWYYQAAIEFTLLDSTLKAGLRDYISEVTGEPYPDYSEVDVDTALELASGPDEDEDLEEIELPDMDDNDESSLFEDEDSLLEEDQEEVSDDDLSEELEDIPMDTPLPEDSYTDVLTAMKFEGKHVVMQGIDEEQEEVIIEYLKSRCGLDVSKVQKRINMWPLLKARPADIFIIGWDDEASEALKTLDEIQQKFPNVPVIFFAGPVSLETRINALNVGAADFITRPVHLSALAQSLLVELETNKVLEEQNPSNDHSVEVDSYDEDLNLSEDTLDDEDLDLSEDTLDDEDLDLSEDTLDDEELELSDDFMDGDLELSDDLDEFDEPL